MYKGYCGVEACYDRDSAFWSTTVFLIDAASRLWNYLTIVSLFSISFVIYTGKHRSWERGYKTLLPALA